jgi:hypothetical protein
MGGGKKVGRLTGLKVGRAAGGGQKWVAAPKKRPAGIVRRVFGAKNGRPSHFRESKPRRTAVRVVLESRKGFVRTSDPVSKVERTAYARTNHFRKSKRTRTPVGVIFESRVDLVRAYGPFSKVEKRSYGRTGRFGKSKTTRTNVCVVFESRMEAIRGAVWCHRCEKSGFARRGRPRGEGNPKLFGTAHMPAGRGTFRTSGGQIPSPATTGIPVVGVLGGERKEAMIRGSFVSAGARGQGMSPPAPVADGDVGDHLGHQPRITRMYTDQGVWPIRVNPCDPWLRIGTVCRGGRRRPRRRLSAIDSLPDPKTSLQPNWIEPVAIRDWISGTV